jgi:hypothetical protein
MTVKIVVPISDNRVLAGFNGRCSLGVRTSMGLPDRIINRAGSHANECPKFVQLWRKQAQAVSVGPTAPWHIHVARLARRVQTYGAAVPSTRASRAARKGARAGPGAGRA